MQNNMANYCDSHGDEIHTCEHFSACIPCVDENTSEQKFLPIIYASCFYCVLAGKVELELEWDSFPELLDHISSAVKIGYHDGKFNNKKAVVGKSKLCKKLGYLYETGYTAGKANDAIM